MNLFKKLISSVCAVAMMVSMVVAVQAADPTGKDPKFVAEIKEGDYDPETGEGTVTISVNGLQTEEAPVMVLTGFSMQVKMLPAEAFDTTLYAYSASPKAPIKKNVVNAIDGSAINFSGAYGSTENGFKFNAAGQWLEADGPVVTIKFKLTEKGKKNGATITVPKATYIADGYDADYLNKVIPQLTYYLNGVSDGDPLATDRYFTVEDKATIKGESSEPQKETVAATPVGGVFEGVNEASDPTTDRAVAAMVDTTLKKAITEITWKINVAAQDGKTYSGPTELKIPVGNLEANSPIKVGLVVSYADADIAGVTITGIEY